MVSRSNREHEILDSVIMEIGLTCGGGSCINLLADYCAACTPEDSTRAVPKREAIDFIFNVCIIYIYKNSGWTMNY